MCWSSLKPLLVYWNEIWNLFLAFFYTVDSVSGISLSLAGLIIYVINLAGVTVYHHADILAV
jgi:hypothetical protein